MAHILILEDEAEVADVLARVLEEAGHAVDRAQDGRQGFERVHAAEVDYDLIICDLHMPRMTGAAFLAEVYELLRWRTPVVVTSGVEYMIEALGELRRGAFSILEKPWHLTDLLGVVERALEQRTVYRRLRELETKVEALSRRNASLVKQNGELFDQARLDALTGLPNRLRLREDLDVLDANDRRYEAPFAIALVDVDRFGRFNKDYGLRVGDAALRFVATMLRDACRRGDLVYRPDGKSGEPAYRFGGDEFVLILAAQGIESAVAAMDRIRDQIARSTTEDLPEPLTISVGVAANARDMPRTIEDMIQAANEELRRAKEVGGNVVRPAVDSEDPPAGARVGPIVARPPL